MARTISEIYDSLNQVKSNMTELAGLVTESTGQPVDTSSNLILDASSGSKVAKWRLWLWIVAVASWVIENIAESRVSEIAAIVNGQRPHTLRWYEAETLKWQYGHDLEWINDDHWGYVVDDPDSRIVSAASASETELGFIELKGARIINGWYQPLSEEEVLHLEAFWSRYKDAGVKVVIVTAEADVLKFNATVVRNRLILAADGTLLRDSGVNPLSQELAEYIANVPFNGIIRITDIEAAAKAAEGIIDFVITSISIRPGDNLDWVPIDRDAVPASGFARIDYVECIMTNIDE